MPEQRLPMDDASQSPKLIAPDEPPALVTRRRFLWYAGAAGVAAYTATMPGGRALIGPPGQRLAVKPLDITYSTWLRRWHDQLSVRFDFINLRPMNGKLVPLVPGQPSFMAVRFWPQHMADEAFFESDGQMADEKGEFKDATPLPNEPVPYGPPVKARLAGESRVAFLVEPAEIDLTTEDLLDWARFQLSVVAAAKPGSPMSSDQPGIGPVAAVGAVAAAVERVADRLKPIIGLPVSRAARPQDPGDHQTGIELPWHLVLSPDTGGAWAHSTSPVDHDTKRFELWHTRLARRVVDVNGDVLTDEDGKALLAEADDPERIIRAIWDRDPGFLNSNCPPAPGPFPIPGFRMSLDRADRYDITRLMSDFAIPDYTPSPAHVKRLMLSSLGGWLDSQADFEPPDGSCSPQTYKTNLTQWRHRAALGRDAYVRTVRFGYLPTQHEVVLVTITERKLAENSEDPPQLGAYLRRRQFVVPLKLDKSYEGALGQKFGGRRYPFRHLRLRTLVTPDIEKVLLVQDNPGNDPDLSLDKVFLIHVNGEPFKFQFTGLDWSGREVDFAAPAAFISSNSAYDSTLVAKISEAYNTLGDDERAAEFHGQAVAVAEPSEGVLGDTDLEIGQLTFGLEVGDDAVLEEDLVKARRPRFHPTMTLAQVRLTAAEQASGGNLGTTSLTYDNEYVEAEDGDVAGGFVHPGEVFVRTQVTGPALTFGGDAPTADRSGGIATPNLAVSGVSRKIGVFGGDPANVQFNKIDFSTFLDEKAVLLGGTRLSDLLPKDASLADAPRLLTERKDDELITHLSWHTLLKSGGNIKVKDKAPFDLESLFVTDLLNPANSTYSVEGEARNLTLVVFKDAPFLEVPINRVRFTSGKNRKPDVHIDVGDVVYRPPLSFINALAEFCSFAGAGGTSIEVTSDRVTARLALELPSIGFGIFSLRNLRFIAAIMVPLTGDPARLRFAFSEPQDKFQILVGPFGGEGHVMLDFGSDGLEAVVVSLGFGGGASIDVGVASGSVEIMAGFEFALQASPDPKPDIVKFTGYVRLGGELEVLGIISVSLTFYVELAYQPEPEKLVGQASLIVEVEVWPISADVEVTVRRSFGNSPNDPTFGQVLTQADWDTYCNAFAPIGA